MKELEVFDIKRFALHDGDGIRTTVFLKGCPLRCAWCANPESQRSGIDIFMFEQKCTGCDRCANICKQHAITVINGKADRQNEKCLYCGNCAEACLNDAIRRSGKKMSCEEVYKTVSRDADYYLDTGGGITLSGGEPLLQSTRLLPLLERCRAAGITISVETCGAVERAAFENILPYVQEFLFDMKSMDKDIFRIFTGGDLSMVLSNFTWLSRQDPSKITARIPVLPGINASQKGMMDILTYVKENGVKKVDLLPYHNLGMSKYKQLGREYHFICKESMKKEEVTEFRNMAEKLGFRVQIGG